MKTTQETTLITIECKKVTFFSPYDEDAFFYWIKKIKSIKEFKGVGDSLLLFVSPKISQKDARNLIGLFRRYKIAFTELRPLINEQNAEFFAYCKDEIWINVYPAIKWNFRGLINYS